MLTQSHASDINNILNSKRKKKTKTKQNTIIPHIYDAFHTRYTHIHGKPKEEALAET